MKKLSLLLKTFVVLMITSGTAIAEESTENVNKFINGTSERVISVIESKASDSTKESNLTSIFSDVMDVDWIAKFVLGRYWSSLDEQQKINYLKTYRKYLISSYVPLFRKYNDQKLVLKDVKSIGNDQYIAITEIQSNQNAQPYNVEYRLKHIDNHFKIHDIIAEGVSLLTTQRSEFAAVMNQGGIDALNNQLNEKSADSN